MYIFFFSTEQASCSLICVWYVLTFAKLLQSIWKEFWKALHTYISAFDAPPRLIDRTNRPISVDFLRRPSPAGARESVSGSSSQRRDGCVRRDAGSCFSSLGADRMPGQRHNRYGPPTNPALLQPAFFCLYKNNGGAIVLFVSTWDTYVFISACARTPNRGGTTPYPPGRHSRFLQTYRAPRARQSTPRRRHRAGADAAHPNTHQSWHRSNSLGLIPHEQITVISPKRFAEQTVYSLVHTWQRVEPVDIYNFGNVCVGVIIFFEQIFSNVANRCTSTSSRAFTLLGLFFFLRVGWRCGFEKMAKVSGSSVPPL